MMDLAQYVYGKLKGGYNVNIRLELKEYSENMESYEYVDWVMDGMSLGDLDIVMFEGIELSEIKDV